MKNIQVLFGVNAPKNRSICVEEFSQRRKIIKKKAFYFKLKQ
jgi:sRNA-binding carbon storage regulator CsrA